MDIIELYMLISIMALTPFAMIGIYKLLRTIFEIILVRKGHVKMFLLTANRGIKQTFGKPIDNDTIRLGKNKLYQFSPRMLYRNGRTPSGIWNEDSINQLDPLTSGESKLSTGRLSELLIRWYNLGVISTMSKEKIMTILLIVAVAAAIGAAGLGFMNFQTLGMVEGRINTAIAKLSEKIAQPPVIAPIESNATVVIR